MKHPYTSLLCGFFCCFFGAACQQSNEVFTEKSEPKERLQAQTTLSSPIEGQGSQPEAPDALHYADFPSFWKGMFVQQVPIGQEDWAKLNHLVHPEHGLFIVSQISDIPISKRFDTFTAIQNELPTFFSAVGSAPQRLPVYATSPQTEEELSVYLVEQPTKGIILDRLLDVQAKVGVPLMEEDQKLAQQLATYELRQVVLQTWFSELIFARIDGKWYCVFWSQLNANEVS